MHSTRRVAIATIAAAAAALGPLLTGLAANTVYDMSGVFITASPAYSTDHTLWAGGQLPRPCLGVPVGLACTDLFVSHDGGTTWTEVPQTQGADIALQSGLNGVILPTTYPTDPTLYEWNHDIHDELLRSDDGGVTWSDILPGAGETTPLPGLPAGQEKLLTSVAGSRVMLYYDEASRLFQPGPTLPADVAIVNRPAFADPSTFYVTMSTATDASAPELVQSHLMRCSLTACTQISDLPPGIPYKRVLLSPTFTTDHTMAALTQGFGVELSTDGGLTWSSLSGHGTLVNDATFAGSNATGAVLVVTSASGGNPDMVTRYQLSGSSYTFTSNATSLSFIVNLVWTSDGHLWAGPNGAFGGSGPVCSPDLGVTWKPSC